MSGNRLPDQSSEQPDKHVTDAVENIVSMFAASGLSDHAKLVAIHIVAAQLGIKTEPLGEN
jgi:hypothetical protein